MRIFYVHWDCDEARSNAESLRADGHEVEIECRDGAAAWKALEARRPDVLVVSLERLPSHGRRTAAAVHERSALHGLPVIFVGGDPEKLEVARREFPEARFLASGRLRRALAGSSPS